jgi:hypothetical protein
MYGDGNATARVHYGSVHANGPQLWPFAKLECQATDGSHGALEFTENLPFCAAFVNVIFRLEQEQRVGERYGK